MKKNVLILVEDQFVREDIIECVRDIHPQAKIRIAENVEEARNGLARHEDWAWAILDVPEADLYRDDIRAAIRDRGALPVVLSEPLEDPQMHDWVFLDRPFNSEMLRSALHRTRSHVRYLPE